MPANPYLHHASVPLWRDGEPEAALLEELEEEQQFAHWLDASQEVVRDHKDASGWEEPTPPFSKRLAARIRRAVRRSSDHTAQDATETMAVIAPFARRGLRARFEFRGEQEAGEPREAPWVARRR